METFKLLARSTNLKSSGASSNGRSKHIPSAGGVSDPQLFRDEEAEHPQLSSGRKRKRDSTSPLESADLELDFFSAPRSLVENKGSRRTPERHSKDSTKRIQPGMEIDELSRPSWDPLPESERRRILQAHKIKITNLSHHHLSLEARDDNGGDGAAKKRRRKKKTITTSEAPTRKKLKELRQLYPDPLVSFEQLRTRYRISRRLYQNLEDQGFTVPTEVQLGSLPLLLAEAKDDSSGNPNTRTGISNIDLFSVAPTGSGKTLSFLIPLLNDIIVHSRNATGSTEKRQLSSLILAPTKELATQIVNEGRKLVKGTGVRITAMRKGVHVVDNEAKTTGNEVSEGKGATGQASHALKSDILVATPLSLVNALSGDELEDLKHLTSIRYLILDEADVLLDPLFRDQTLQLWNACKHPDLRVSLWSATMGSNVEELTRSTIQSRRELLDISEDTPLVRLVVGLKDSAIPNLSHKLVYAATEQGKLLGLRQLFHPSSRDSGKDVHLRPPFLVFTQTIPRAVALHSELLYDIPAEAGGSSRIAVLHSDLSDNQRSEVMARFRKGEIWVMITTDLLARGVDFRGINGVVNYDIPNSSAAYVHRVGRTGRAGREGGIAVTFYTKEDIPYVKNIANVIAASEKAQGKSGKSDLQKWLLDALPKPSKKEKKELKLRGVAARRTQTTDKAEGQGSTKSRISTKSGFDRRLENNRKGAVRHSKMQKLGGSGYQLRDNESDEWEGIDS
jgi:ATP-dependent RNA helicase DDX52/ROK1